MSQIIEPHNPEDLVQVSHLAKYFPVRAGLMQRVVNWVKAVDDVSFTVKRVKLLAWSANQAVEKPPLGAPCLGWLNQLRGRFIMIIRMS